MEFEIPRLELEKLVKGSNYYFVSLVCNYKWGNINSRVVYSTIEVPSLQPILTEMNRNFFGTLLGIFVIVLGLMVCGYIIIIKKALKRVWRYMNPGGEEFIEEQSNMQKGGT